jgi:tetratricopeptide (TPR) repeat protein
MKNATISKQASLLGLAVRVCAGLLFGSALGHAAPLQAPSGAGLGAANQAYQEAADKKFAVAVEDFQKALAANPSNSRLRKDLGYAYLAAGSPKDAAGQFEAVYREHPDDLRTALDLGYVLEQLHQDDAALQCFETAGRSTDPQISGPAQQALANLRASQRQAQKQRAYDLLAQGKRAEALQLFEAVREVDPSDSATTMQLGYLYASAGRMTQAREMFTLERDNPDPQAASQAAAALELVNRESRLWFTSFYAAPFYQSRFANQINPLNAKIGLRSDRYLQPYVGLRLNRDVRSRSGTLPEIFSDNSAVLALGVQSSILGKGTNLYAEAGTAVSLLSQPTHGRAVPDYRAGLTWFRSWGTSFTGDAGLHGRELSLTGSAYSDVGFYSRYDHNVIGYLQVREGLNLPTARLLPVQVLAAVNFLGDSNGNFYNNVIEAGPDLRLAPFRRLLGVWIEAQYLRGIYTRHDLANPYGPRYEDVRVFLIWSKSF